MKQKRKRKATGADAKRVAPNVSINTPHGAVPLVGALTMKEAAIYLNVSVVTLIRLMQRGVIRSNRMTRYHLFPISELDRALNEGLVE